MMPATVEGAAKIGGGVLAVPAQAPIVGFVVVCLLSGDCLVFRNKDWRSEFGCGSVEKLVMISKQ